MWEVSEGVMYVRDTSQTFVLFSSSGSVSFFPFSPFIYLFFVSRVVKTADVDFFFFAFIISILAVIFVVSFPQRQTHA